MLAEISAQDGVKSRAISLLVEPEGSASVNVSGKLDPQWILICKMRDYPSEMR